MGSNTPARDVSTVAVTAVMISAAATVQLVVVLGVEWHPGVLVMPIIVVVVVSTAMVRLRRARDHEHTLRAELERKTAQVNQLNHELAQLVDDRTLELRSREAELLQAQKMEAVGRLAGGIAHDFNNLLTTILHGAELVRERAQQPDQVIQIGQDIELAGRKASDLVRKLLTFARKRRIHTTHVPVDIGDVVRGLEPLVKRMMGRRSALVVEVAPELPSVLGDRVHLEQVLLNLVVNARDAMPSGGQLRILVDQLPPGSELPARMLQAAGGTLRLRVADTGTGIPNAVKDKVLEPYFTTKDPGAGTGLGLSVVHSVVDGLGGVVRIDSQVGQGTTVTVLLPANAAAVSSAPDEAHTGPRPNGLRILLIDDDDGVRAMLRTALESVGHEVIDADGGVTAEARARREGDTFDLVLSDIRMPGRSGIELAPRWRALLPRARVMLMTGYTEAKIDPSELERLGVAGVLRKPFSVDALQEALRA